MEEIENVALDSSKQKKFVKSLKGLRKKVQLKKTAPKAEESAITKTEEEKAKKKKSKGKGLVYLGHIPHGFYEHQMTQYFKQFGVVTNVRVIRSKRTGSSKGYGFVEFKDPAVAEIVAETMNNYLMGKRLIKAVCIPPEKQKRAERKHWNSVNNPANIMRMKCKKEYNTNKDEAGELKQSEKLLATLTKTKKKLRELGINYDFFQPVDVPKELLHKITKDDNKHGDDANIKVKEENTVKKSKKEETPKQIDKKSKEKITNKIEKSEKLLVDETQIKKKNKDEAKKKSIMRTSIEKEKADIGKIKVNNKEQTTKQLSSSRLLKYYSTESASDDDSVDEFDSDEYERVQNEESASVEDSDLSADESTYEDSKVDSSDEDLPREVVPKTPMLVQSPHKKQSNKQQVKKSSPLQMKRSVLQNNPVPSKKPKFMKQTTQKPLKKHFKKKK